MTRRCVVIGLDGGTFTVLDPLMDEGVMPFLKQVIAEGVRSPLISVIPPLTPPAWASLMTGRGPGNHGVFDFYVPESPDSRYLRLADSRHLNCETLWSIVSRQGMTATTLNFPLMAPPRPISGYSVAGWVPWRYIKQACYPQSLYDDLKNLPGFNPRELAMDVALERKAIEGCAPEEMEEWVRFHMRREQQWFAIFKHIMQKDPSDVMAVLFDGVDKLQHLFWRFLDPACLPASLTPEEARIRDLCLDYFRQLDRIIADIFDVAGPDADVFIVSDHGFGPSVEIFHINTWLSENGYLRWTNKAPVTDDTAGRLIGVDAIWRDPYLLDWNGTMAYAVTPSSNAVHICVAGKRGAEGIPPHEYEQVRRQLMDGLSRFVDPETQQPIVTRIWTREEAFSGRWIDLAPDLTLELRDGGFVSVLRTNTTLEPRPEPVGAHRRDGIFLAAGPSVRKGMKIQITGSEYQPLSILDIAPTVLYTLGLPVPSDMEGAVSTAIFRPEVTSAQPIRFGGATQQVSPYPRQDDAEMDSESEEAVVARLKALGYLE